MRAATGIAPIYANMCSRMTLQLTLDAADEVAKALEAQGGALSAEEAARVVLRAQRVPPLVAKRVLEDLVASDARLALRGDGGLSLAGYRPAQQALSDVTFCVVDLETTGGSAARDRIVEIGSVRVEALELGERFERLCDPGRTLPPAITALTGIDDRMVRGAASPGSAVDAWLRFAGDAVIVAHNARFDLAFLDAALGRRERARIAAPVLDTLQLARRLLGRRRGLRLSALADRFDTTTSPCHRALADALATAEILLALLGRAQEHGAETLEDILILAQPPVRRAVSQRRLADDAPRAPGTYVMRDRTGQPMYAGTASDLRRRAGSYFRGTRQPSRLERVLPAVAAIDYHVAGSAFEARLDEIALLERLRPPGNRRGTRPERSAYVRVHTTGVDRISTSDGCEPRDGEVVVGPLARRRDADQFAAALRLALRLRDCRGAEPTEGTCLKARLAVCHGPCRGAAEQARHRAAAAVLVRALHGDGGVPIRELRDRRSRLAVDLRFEEAARLRDAELDLRRASRRLSAIRRARTLCGIVLAGHTDRTYLQAFVVAYGLVVERRPLVRGGGGLEVSALVRSLRRALAERPAGGALAVPAARLDELWLVASAFAGAIGEVAVAPDPGDDEQLRELVLDACAAPFGGARIPRMAG